ncbi:MAG: alpha-mannosidase [Phycisphaeraceae bacterium]|nr:alpha-mannosidase [Phycisphaeraceae bacterium]
MLIPNVHEIIRHYLVYLDGRKYDDLGRLAVQTAIADRDYAQPPEHLTWTDAPLPYAFGREWTTWWFRATATVPEAARGRALYAQLMPSIDSLVYVNGEPAGGANHYHTKIRLTDSAKASETFRIHVETYAGHKMPSGGSDDFVSFQGGNRLLVNYARGPLEAGHGSWQDDHPLYFREARLLVRNQPLYDLYYAAFILYNLASQLEDHSIRKGNILSGLYHALMKVKFTASPADQRQQAKDACDQLQPLLKCRNGDSALSIHCIGHGHLDTTWLWQRAETRRKIARTFSSMIRLGEEHPDFIFLQSQPCHVDWIAQLYPSLLTKIRQAHQQGRWDPNGSAWVETDTNLPGGESLIRQFILGHQTTRHYFASQGDAFWAPDNFGHSAALPQILRGCEVRFFVSTRIGGNDPVAGRDFPYDLFQWRGIDGSAVDALLLSSGYGMSVNPEKLVNAGKLVRHPEVGGQRLACAGYGDGGGGTTRSDMVVMPYVRDLEGCPKAAWNNLSSALHAMFDEANNLPVWQGDLEIPYFQGTFTTNAHLKKNNRQLERQFRETEWLAAMTMPSVWPAVRERLNAAGNSEAMAYPTDDLRGAWKKLLTTHFHDGITGAAFHKVNEELAADQTEIADTLDGLIQPRKNMLANVLNTEKTARPHVCFNSLSWDRRSTVLLTDAGDGAALVRADAPISLGQTTKNLDGQAQQVFVVSAPAMGAAVYSLESSRQTPLASPFRYTGDTLTTPHYDVRFDDRGRIVSLFDHATGHQFVQPDQALNTFEMGEDATLVCDAWNIDSAHRLKTETCLPPARPIVVSDGHILFQLRCEMPLGRQSRLTQDMVFHAEERRIDFVTRVHWHESNQWLKAAFPVAVFAQTAKCEIQYGHINRNVHTNLKQDRDRYEMCAHKWVALEDGARGAALLNDGKYGCDAREAVLRLTLLRSPKSPDAEMDMGTHCFTYSFLPYAREAGIAQVVREAYNLNVPLTLTPTDRHDGKADTLSLFRLDHPHVVLEVVKKAEDDDHVVLRLYEVSGSPRTATLTSPLNFDHACEVNMLERNESPMTTKEHELTMTFRAFEIKTVKVRLS